MRFLLPIFCLLCFRVSISAQDVLITDHGAVSDGTTLNTVAIQQAVDAAHVRGGGRVVVPAGRFATGAFVIRSGVELHLAEGAVLLGSTDPKDYFRINRWLALVMADGASDIALTGPGEIDGRGRALALHIDSLFYAGRIDSAMYNFVEVRPSHLIRPQLVEFVACTRVRVRDITMRNAACWVQTYDQCRDVVLERVRVESDAYWNNDGIDIQDCINVRVTDCIVNSSDDGICLKSQSKEHGCDSIYIARCTVRSSASAVKFGTVSHAGFRNVVIEDIRVYDTFRSAVAVECVDGGTLENVLIQRIDAVNTGNAIFIRLGKRNKSGDVGKLRNVTIRDMRVEVAFERPDYAYEVRGPDLPFFHNTFPSSITGLPGHPVENVILENVEIRYPGRGNDGLARKPLSRLDAIPEKATDYPEFSMFGELPAWGFYVRHVDGLVFRNVRIGIDAPDYRPAYVFDDVHDLEMKGSTVTGDDKPMHVVLYKSPGVNLDDQAGVLRM